MGCAQSIWVLIGRIMLILLYWIYDLSLEKIIGTKYYHFHDMFYKKYITTFMGLQDPQVSCH